MLGTLHKGFELHVDLPPGLARAAFIMFLVADVHPFYLRALRALTRRHRPAPLVDMLVKAQRFSHLEFSPYPRILRELERRHWFREPDEARIVD